MRGREGKGERRGRDGPSPVRPRATTDGVCSLGYLLSGSSLALSRLPGGGGAVVQQQVEPGEDETAVVVAVDRRGGCGEQRAREQRARDEPAQPERHDGVNRQRRGEDAQKGPAEQAAGRNLCEGGEGGREGGAEQRARDTPAVERWAGGNSAHPKDCGAVRLADAAVRGRRAGWEGWEGGVHPSGPRGEDAEHREGGGEQRDRGVPHARAAQQQSPQSDPRLAARPGTGAGGKSSLEDGRGAAERAPHGEEHRDLAAQHRGGEPGKGGVHGQVGVGAEPKHWAVLPRLQPATVQKVVQRLPAPQWEDSESAYSATGPLIQRKRRPVVEGFVAVSDRRSESTVKAHGEQRRQQQRESRPVRSRQMPGGGRSRRLRIWCLWRGSSGAASACSHFYRKEVIPRVLGTLLFSDWGYDSSLYPKRNHA